MPITTNVLAGGFTINEIHAQPFGAPQDYNQSGTTSFQDMYIEFVNTSGAPIDISGFELHSNGVIYHTFAGAAGSNTTVIPAGGRITIVDSEESTAFPITGISGTVTYSTGPMVYGENYNLLLYDPNANQYIVFSDDGPSSATFLASTDIPGLLSFHPTATQTGSPETLPSPPLPNGNSIQRIADGEDSFIEQFATAGTANCFLTGTLIDTPTGSRRVEDLGIGDDILTADGRVVSVFWNAHQTLRMFQRGPHTDPVRIVAGALGNGLPSSDLVLTADHGLMVDDLLINASALVNGDSIRFVQLWEMPGRMTFHHVETEAHDVILANGVPAETFIDYVGRAAFDNHAEYLDLYGCERLIPEMPAPRISTARLLPEAIRARLGIAMETVLLSA